MDGRVVHLWFNAAMDQIRVLSLFTAALFKLYIPKFYTHGDVEAARVLVRLCELLGEDSHDSMSEANDDGDHKPIHIDIDKNLIRNDYYKTVVNSMTILHIVLFFFGESNTK